MKSFAEEIFKIAKFGVVGLCATLVHLVVALAVGHLLPNSSVMLMNTSGFLVALFVSFFGHYHITFLSSQSYKPAFVKFACIAIAAYLASSLCIVLTSHSQLTEIWRLILGILIIPLISYVANRKIIF